MKLKTIGYAAAGLLLASRALALSGAEMVHYCAANACGGYFVGAFDGVRIAAALGNDKQRTQLSICPPDAVSDEQIVDVALDYLRRHPQAGHLSAANLALRAWRERWPCQP